MYLFLSLFIFITSCNNSDKNTESQAWQNANKECTIDAFLKFEDNFPESKYLTEAKNKIDSIDNKLWDSVLSVNTEEAYNNYLKITHLGLHAEDARNNIAILQDQPKENIDNDDRITVFYKTFTEQDYNYNALLKFFDSECTFKLYENDQLTFNKILTTPFSAQQLDSAGYWNIFNNGNSIFDTFSHSSDVITKENDKLTISITYWDNGSVGNFETIWEKESDGWYIYSSTIYLPNFM